MSPRSDARSLDNLFKAKSVAIVGISSEAQKIGTVIFKNLKEGGYQGKIFLINPKYQNLYDLPCYPSLTAVPEEIDCACIAVPAQFVKQVMSEAAEKKVASAVIITAGFGEKGPEGKALEREITTIANEAGINILGPNCLGFMNLHDKINLSFAATVPEVGDVALLSQSGAICTAILDLAEKDNLGFSHVISVGNKANLSENKIISYVLKDPNTHVIGCYLEDLHHGRELLDLYAAAQNSKPLVIIKPGISDAGKKAIGSHTGAVTGSAITTKVALSQAGILQAETLEEFYSLLQCFSQCQPLRGSNIAILTNAGGPGILATDGVVGDGLSLADLSEYSRAELKKILPAEASVQNPIDILGDAKADRFEQALNLLTQDKGIDGIVIIITPQYVTQVEETCEVIAEISKRTDKTIITALLGNFVVEKGKQILRDNRCAYTTEIKTAVNTLRKMYFYTQRKDEIGRKTGAPPVKAKRSNNLPTVLMSTQASNNLASSYGITLPEQLVCNSYNIAQEWAADKYPVVLKVPSEIAAHKTELKGVYTKIQNAEDLQVAWEKLAEAFPNNTLRHIQKQLSFEEEFFIGATKDDSFGYLMVFGTGGIYTEEYADYGYILLPASRHEILEALAQTKIAKILVGARGKKPLPVDKIVYTIEKFQTMLLEHPEIVSLDVNPLLITPTEASAVDIKCYTA